MQPFAGLCGSGTANDNVEQLIDFCLGVASRTVGHGSNVWTYIEGCSWGTAWWCYPDFKKLGRYAADTWCIPILQPMYFSCTPQCQRRYRQGGFSWLNSSHSTANKTMLELCYLPLPKRSELGRDQLDNSITPTEFGQGPETVAYSRDGGQHVVETAMLH